MYLSEEGMDAECLLKESALPLRLHLQLLVEMLQFLQALPDVMRCKVSASDLRASKNLKVFATTLFKRPFSN